VDTRVFLNHLFKLFVQTIDELSKNAASQRTLYNSLDKVLEENKEDIPTRSRLCILPPIRSAHGLSTLIGEEIEKSISLDANRCLVEALRQCLKDLRAPNLKPFFDMELDLDALSHYYYEGYSATASHWAGVRWRLNERRVVSREWGSGEQNEQEVEAAGSQLEKKFRDDLKRIVSSNVSAKKKVDILNKTGFVLHEIFGDGQKSISVIEETLQQILQARQQKKGDVFLHRPKPAEVVQPPDLSEIPTYQGRRGRRKQGSPPEVKPLDFLKTHYSQWLSSFGAVEDSVFQENIRAHDPDLIKGIDNQFRTEGKGRKVSDFVKTRSARVDRELENTDPEYLRKAHRETSRLEIASKRRKLKANRSPKHR
jgi:hypothetical protein